MAPRITDETRRAVEEDLRERWGVVGTRVIAEAHGIAPSSVRLIAKSADITLDDNARANTKKATEQAVDRMKVLRERLRERLLDVAIASLDEMDRGSVIAGISFGEVVSGRATGLTARDRQALSISAGIAIDKHRVLVEMDSDQDNTDLAKFLRALGRGLG